MVFFNQLIMRNILNGHEDLGAPELRADVATFTNEQHDDTICFLMHESEQLAGLSNGQVIHNVANVCTLLDYLTTIEPNVGGGPCDRVTYQSAGGAASYMLPKFQNFLGQLKDGFKFIEEFKKKSVGMCEPKCVATFGGYDPTHSN